MDAERRRVSLMVVGVVLAWALVACAARLPLPHDAAPALRAIAARVPATADTVPVAVPDYVTIVTGMPWWTLPRYGGITLGTAGRPTIHFRDSVPDVRNVWHELRHAAQLRERGAVRYYLGWLLRTALHGYTGNAMEVEAEQVAAAEYRAHMRLDEQ